MCVCVAQVTHSSEKMAYKEHENPKTSLEKFLLCACPGEDIVIKSADRNQTKLLMERATSQEGFQAQITCYIGKRSHA